ncbi:MAG: hypothetical protein HYU28_05165 [Actinobacteria bacterium]|nr:hypothetical protein [Actinomycetota bacterium]
MEVDGTQDPLPGGEETVEVPTPQGQSALEGRGRDHVARLEVGARQGVERLLRLAPLPGPHRDPGGEQLVTGRQQPSADALRERAPGEQVTGVELVGLARHHRSDGVRGVGRRGVGASRGQLGRLGEHLDGRRCGPAHALVQAAGKELKGATRRRRRAGHLRLACGERLVGGVALTGEEVSDRRPEEVVGVGQRSVQARGRGPVPTSGVGGAECCRHPLPVGRVAVRQGGVGSGDDVRDPSLMEGLFDLRCPRRHECGAYSVAYCRISGR